MGVVASVKCYKKKSCMLICPTISYELLLIATQQQMSACAEFKTKCQYELISNFENDKFIKIVCSGRVFLPDGGSQGRGSDEAGEHKQTVCFRLTQRHLYNITFYKIFYRPEIFKT